MSSRHVFKIIQDMSSKSFKESLQDVFKTSGRLLQHNKFLSSNEGIFKMSCEISSRRLCKSSSRRLGKRKIIMLRTSSRYVLKTSSWDHEDQQMFQTHQLTTIHHILSISHDSLSLFPFQICLKPQEHAHTLYYSF